MKNWLNLLHSHNSAYTSLFRHEKGRNTTRLFIGDSYFNKTGKGDINTYLNPPLYDLENVRGKGYIGMITGNHDMQRLAYKRDTEEIKAAMVFYLPCPEFLLFIMVMKLEWIILRGFRPKKVDIIVQAQGLLCSGEREKIINFHQVIHRIFQLIHVRMHQQLKDSYMRKTLCYIL
ncbi:MAG: hypothetical protein IKW64_01780 [Clostridia bacterium]|nr:hypothetical protein [Clostridia bacterium]